MASVVDIGFNKSPSGAMYVDINSCFATVEQQANPLLRGKPIAVVAYDTPNGCVLAASIEAKGFGVKTGMRFKEAKKLCPNLASVLTDPNKYRHIHERFKKLLSCYTPHLSARSIDEFALNMKNTPAQKNGLFTTAEEIKLRIKKEIGDYITVSIGIAPSFFLAKTASNLKKPDGLEEINYSNYEEVYHSLELQDLTGIASQNCLRLNNVGIFTVEEFYKESVGKLKQAFNSTILSRLWYLRLRGFEVDEGEWPTKSFGHTYSLPKALSKKESLPILSKLTEKVGSRMRQANYQAKGVHLGIIFQSREYWHQGMSLDSFISSSADIYKVALHLIQKAPEGQIRNLFITCYSLNSLDVLQLDLFGQRVKNQKVTVALDEIESKWGSFSVIPGTMAGTESLVPDRIGFNNTP